MIPLFPLVLLSGLFLATKPSKKKASAFQLVQTGSIARLPLQGQQSITIDLRVGQMLDLVAASSPSSNWIAEIEGGSVKVDKSVRMQDAVTQQVTFSIKALSLGDSKIVFKKYGREGDAVEARHLRIAVME